MKILVLCGGESPERLISLASGDAVANWISEAGYEVWKYDPETTGQVWSADKRMAPDEIGSVAPQGHGRRGFHPDVVAGLLDVLSSLRPNFVFPILHGGFGENGTVQALLEWVQIPYAGSGPVASGIAMDKHLSRALFRTAGVPIARGFVVSASELADSGMVDKRISKSIGYPVVIKPRRGGSTIGLSKVSSTDGLQDALGLISDSGDDVLIEEQITGRELTVSIVDGEAYPLVEVRPHEGFYDYHNKYTAGRTEYLCPAPIPELDTGNIQDLGLRAFSTLGCEGFGRVDFLYTDQGKTVCLEVNTLPGMTVNSLVPKAARARGESPPELMQKIIQCSLRKQQALTS